MAVLSKKELVVRVVLDCFCVFLAYLPWIICQNMDPYHQGFFCNDETIRYPYKASTIPGPANAAFNTVVPILVILVIEGVYKFHLKENSPVTTNYENINCGLVNIPPYVVDCYNFLLVFLFGAAVTESITNVGKYTMGRLRPNFIDVCQPDFNSVKCWDEEGHFRFVTEDVCGASADPTLVRKGRLSFPSGHSSLAFYSMSFVAMYLQKRFWFPRSELFKHLLQFVVLIVATLIGMSRIRDNKHHWSDVLAGSLLGITVAISTVVFISGLYHRYSRWTLAHQITSLVGKVCSDTDSLLSPFVVQQPANLNPNNSSTHPVTRASNTAGARDFLQPAAGASELQISIQVPFESPAATNNCYLDDAENTKSINDESVSLDLIDPAIDVHGTHL